MEVICMKKMNVIKIMMLLLCGGLVVDVQALLRPGGGVYPERSRREGQAMKRRRSVCETWFGCKREKFCPAITPEVSPIAPASPGVPAGESKAEARLSPAGYVAPTVHKLDSPAAPPAPTRTGARDEKTEEKPENLINKAYEYVDTHIDDVLDKISFLDSDGVRYYMGRKVESFDFFYIKKKAQARMRGATKLRACIAKHKLHLLFVPDKILYIVPIDQVTRHDITRIPREFCIAEKIKGSHIKAVNLEQIKQLCRVVEKTLFFDFDAGKNIILCDDGRIAFIDTDDRGFAGNGSVEISDDDAYVSLPVLLKISLSLNLEPDALEYIEAKIKKYEDQKRKKIERFLKGIPA